MAAWVTQSIWEGGSLKVMGRGYDKNRLVLTQAKVASIRYRCVASGTTEVIALTALTVASVIFDTLQTTALDAAWTKDETGYNFMYIFPPATFPDGGITYYLPIEFTDVTSPTAIVSYLNVKATTAETYIDTPA